MPTPFRFRSLAAVLALRVILQPSAALSQPDDEVRSLFQQGRAVLYRAPETARMAFEKAYRLRPTPQIAYNLGLAELETGRYVDAAKHIALYVRQNPKPTDEERRALAAAERHVAHLVFDVNIAGAHVYLDDESIGLTPFVSQPIYVLAGRHTILVTCDGFQDATQVRDVEAGRATEIKIVLEPISMPPSLASAGGVASDAGAAGGDAGAPIRASADPRPPDAPAVSARTIVLAGGATLTAAAVALAVVEAFRASSADSDVHDRSAAVGQGAADVCRRSPSAACSDLSEAADRHQTAIDLMRGAWIGAAVIGGATAAAWFLWPGASARIRATPQVQPSMVGLTISGEIQ